MVLYVICWVLFVLSLVSGVVKTILGNTQDPVDSPICGGIGSVIGICIRTAWSWYLVAYTLYLLNIDPF